MMFLENYSLYCRYKTISNKNMTYQEVYNIIANVEGKSANVWITGKESGKRYKQNIRIIDGSNQMKMRNVGSSAMGYNVNPFIADKWANVEVCKKHKKKDTK